MSEEDEIKHIIEVRTVWQNLKKC